MKILELHMKHFGKFTDQRVRFGDGIQVISGENGMGKTTMHSFIRGMLFGIERQRGRAARNDEYTLRQPWENGGYFSGTLWFESGGKTFRLERNFYQKEKSASLVCETDGEELSLEAGDLESLMEGMSREAFFNTVFIPQGGGRTEEGLARELRNYMSNLQSAGDGEIDVNLALARLEKRTREAQNRRKQEAAGNTEQMQELQMRLDYVEQELLHLAGQQKEAGFRYEQARAALNQERTRRRGEEKIREKRDARQTGGAPGQYFILLVLGLAVLLGSIFVPGILPKILLLSAWLLLFGLYLFQKRGEGRKTPEASGQEEVSAPDLEADRLRWEEERLTEEIREKQILRDNLEEERQEAFERVAARGGAQEEEAALGLAAETLRRLSDEIYRESARNLNERVSEILCQITGGSYTSVFLDADMQVRINTPEKLLGLWQVSRGTMEQIYFALRMAAGELLSHGAPMPVILDDAFVMYDDERLRQTLSWLKESQRQVLLFTCQRREAEILSRL